MFAAVSQTTRRDWLRVLPEVSWVPNGIDLRHWAARSGRPVPPPRPDLAVWAGRITPEKGLTVAIEATARAGYRLDISGPVADPRYFAGEIQPRLDGRVRYVGHLDHRRLPDFLHRGRVFVFSPLWQEPFGLVAVEAMAAGTPVAALPSGAVPEVVGPRGGVVSADLTPASLAEAIRRAASLDRAAVARSVRRYAVTTMVDAYEVLIERARVRSRDRTGDPDRVTAGHSVRVPGTDRPKETPCR